MTSTTKKLTGLPLLSAIKEELGSVIQAENISEMDLFLAAQQLIEISRSEYIEPEFREQAEKAGYYSHAVDTAITKMQSSLWRNETTGWHDEDDPMRFQEKQKDFLTTGRRHLLVERFDA